MHSAAAMVKAWVKARVKAVQMSIESPPDPTLYIERLIEGTNKIMTNSEIPMFLHSLCMSEIDVRESQSERRLKDFLLATSGVHHSLASASDKYAKMVIESMLNTADIAIVMTATHVEYWTGSTGGAAWLGPAPKERRLPLAWVGAGSAMVESYDPVQPFAHEIGHLFGCDHNREELGGGRLNETSYGYLVEGKYRTTMVHHTHGEEWVPYFSSKDIQHEGMPLGDEENSNRDTILMNRFLMSEIGDETGNCSTNMTTSCAGRCIRGDLVPANLTLKEKEIWCRSNCNMPASGYFNLLGEPVGLDDGMLIRVIVFYVIPILTVIIVGGCLTKIILFCPSKRKKYQELKAKIKLPSSTTERACIFTMFGMLIDGGFVVAIDNLHFMDHKGVIVWVLAGLVDGGFLYALRYVQ